MSDNRLSPAPWRAEEITIPSHEQPIAIRILAADGTKVCDLYTHPSVGGDLERARANAAHIVKQRMAL